MCGLREVSYETLQAYLYLPQACLQASMKHMYTHFCHFQMVCLRANSGQTELGQDGEHDCSWSARCHNIHTHIKIPPPPPPNLEESQEWPQGPSKSRNSSESRKIPLPSVFYILVFVLVQRHWACFTWKGALEIKSVSYYYEAIQFQRCITLVMQYYGENVAFTCSWLITMFWLY